MWARYFSPCTRCCSHSCGARERRWCHPWESQRRSMYSFTLKLVGSWVCSRVKIRAIFLSSPISYCFNTAISVGSHRRAPGSSIIEAAVERPAGWSFEALCVAQLIELLLAGLFIRVQVVLCIKDIQVCQECVVLNWPMSSMSAVSGLGRTLGCRSIHPPGAAAKDGVFCAILSSKMSHFLTSWGESADSPPSTHTNSPRVQRVQTPTHKGAF